MTPRRRCRSARARSNGTGEYATECLHQVYVALEESGQQIDALFGDVVKLFQTGHVTENLLFALAVRGEELREQRSGAFVAKIHPRRDNDCHDARTLIGSLVVDSDGDRFGDGWHPLSTHGVSRVLESDHVSAF